MQGHKPVHIHWTQTNVYLCWGGPFYISWLATLQAKCRLGMTFIVLYFFYLSLLAAEFIYFLEKISLPHHILAYPCLSLPFICYIHLLYKIICQEVPVYTCVQLPLSTCVTPSTGSACLFLYFCLSVFVRISRLQ